jgi:hypothetical protein
MLWSTALLDSPPDNDAIVILFTILHVAIDLHTLHAQCHCHVTVFRIGWASCYCIGGEDEVWWILEVGLPTRLLVEGVFPVHSVALPITAKDESYTVGFMASFCNTCPEDRSAEFDPLKWRKRM